MSDDRRGALKNRLLQQINDEERLIRIYTADILLTRNRKRPRVLERLGHENDDAAQASQILALSENHENQEDDWLAALDTLQPNFNDVSGMSDSPLPKQLDTRWHDDPRLFQVIPYVSGIVLNAAKPMGTTQIQESTRYRSFYFRGYTSDSSVQRVDFEMTLAVEFGTSATRISQVDLSFSNYENEEELQDIIKIAKEWRNIPLLFRQVVGWAKFHSRRNKAFDVFLKRDVRLIRVSASLIRVNWSLNSSLDICWRWHVTWATCGNDVLKIQNCRVAREHEVMAAAVTLSHGLQNLIKCEGGDCVKALDIILQVV